MSITYQSLATEAAIRWPGQADQDRLARAVEIAGRQSMIYNAKCSTGEFDVRSATGAGWYHVNTRAHTCTCQDSQHGHICKHRLAVWLYTECIARTLAAAHGHKTSGQVLAELGYS